MFSLKCFRRNEFCVLVIPGWESLLHVVKNSILSGSKEVALAAINCLQSTILSHSPKVNVVSAFTAYCNVLWMSIRTPLMSNSD